MPYNSSAFERQLAKYKNAQAAKKAAEAPHDPHVVRSRVAVDPGSIKPNKNAFQDSAEQERPARVLAQTVDPELVPIIVRTRKKPFYLSGWFIFLATSLLSVAAVPVFFKEEMNEVLAMGQSIKTTTGVDPFSIKTYSAMARGTPPPPVAPANPEPAASAVAVPAPAPVPAAVAPAARVPAKTAPVPPPDYTNVDSIIQKVEENAQAVTSKGADHSMQYIEEETRRLQEMAKQFDEQYKR